MSALADDDTTLPDAGPRAHVASLEGLVAGEIVSLEAAQAKHLTRVRRLADGAAVVAFDDAGRVAAAVLDGDSLRLTADPADPARGDGGEALTVYAATPKGSRADWMVEKLSELGAGRLVPLACARGVVEPGAGKLDRWARLARESAKQSRRGGVMSLGPVTPLADALAQVAGTAAVVLTTELPGARPFDGVASAVFVGPEGGWTAGELSAFAAANVTPARLSASVLRIETAAICAASVWTVRRAAADARNATHTPQAIGGEARP